VVHPEKENAYQALELECVLILVEGLLRAEEKEGEKELPYSIYGIT